MSQPPALKLICRHLGAGGRLTLFLDYDGTLVPIAPAPDEARPDPALLELLAHLAQAPGIQPVILSGRCLASLEEMLPVPGLVLAGTYGVEIKQDQAVTLRGVRIHHSRPVINKIKFKWEQLVQSANGFLLEDKGCAVALHARWAEPDDADRVLSAARTVASGLIHDSHFRLQGGDRFLEILPNTANKKQAVHWLLSRNPRPDTLPVYFGDDDKDDDAFDAIRIWGGVSIGVGARYPLAQAAARVASPDVVRAWLREILAAAC